MRELKFRIWVKDEERYYDETDEESYQIIPNGQVTYTSEAYEEDGVFYTDTTNATNNVVVEQYTGLKDKNGKEIYEGDIVKTTDRVTVKGLIFPVGVVEFKQQAFWICNVPSERPDFTHNETLLQYLGTDLEIIGTIHENMELLEAKC